MNQYKFDVEKTVNECVKWIRAWIQRNAPHKKMVIGISGGIDSAVAAALCSEATKGNIALYALPNIYQEDIKDAREVMAHFDYLSFPVINIGRAYTEVLMEMSTKGVQPSQQAITNLPPRLRMAVLYALAQSINGVVVNTSNLSESYVGYDTLFGDQCGSFSPLGKLTKTEIAEIGKYYHLPQAILKKAPADGLTGRSDEEAFGFTYKELDTYLRTNVCEQHVIDKIEKLHKKNAFKSKMVQLDTFEPSQECLYMEVHHGK